MASQLIHSLVSIRDNFEHFQRSQQLAPPVELKGRSSGRSLVQVLQFFTMFSICADSPGHQTDDLVCQLLMPS